MRETSINSISLFRHVNAVETLRFARQAALAGVRRFVFLSTIKVNGEFSLPHCPFTENELLIHLILMPFLNLRRNLDFQKFLLKREWRLLLLGLH